MSHLSARAFPFAPLVFAVAVGACHAASAPQQQATPRQDAGPRDAAAAREPEPAQEPKRDAKVRWTQTELEQISAEIQAEVEELRGEKFAHAVPVKLASKDEFFKYAVERTERTEPPEKIAADETVARMLGLVPPDFDLLQESLKLVRDQVGGFYDPGTKSFYLMDNCPAGVAKIVLAHELDHALDDQLYDIDGGLSKRASVTDATLAYAAVVEGSGTAIMTRWALPHLAEIDMGSFDEMQKDANASMAAAPMFLWKPLLASYLCGAAFLARSESLMAGQTGSAKNEDINRAFRDPPTSTEQVLHPDRYWDPARRDEPRALVYELGALPSGWKELRRDVFGELALAILTTPPSSRAAPDFSSPMAIVSLTFTDEVATGWGGDALILLGNEEGRILKLTTAWDSERDAAEFFGAMQMLQPDLEKAVRALDAAVVAKDAGGKTPRKGAAGANASAKVRYGGEKDMVVIELAYGVKSSDAKKVFAALACRESAPKAR